MPFFLLMIPALFYLRSFIPFSELFSLSSQIHRQCLEQLSFQSEWLDIYKALICGKKLPYGEIKQTFIQGGCIHLMVVSGAHLLFVEKLWSKISFPFYKTIILFLILIIYALASQLQPPVMRALFTFALFYISKSKRLFWNSCFVTHMSGFLCLLFQPQWIYSTSLQLSWLASFLQNLKTSNLMKASLTYLFIFPIVNRWQQLHPLTVFVNWLVVPAMGTFLFPLTVISFFFSPFHHLSDLLWKSVLKILQIFNTLTSSLFFPNWHIPLKMLWLYIIVIFTFISIIEIKRRRAFRKKEF